MFIPIEHYSLTLLHLHQSLIITMSFEDENDYWSNSGVRPFNFDEDDQSSDIASSSHPNTGQSDSLRTVESILAAKPSSNEPFLRPSIIMCNTNRVEQLVDNIDILNPPLTQPIKPDPRAFIIDILDKKRPIDFSIYKSKREKLMLLDCAIGCSDGNLITAITIFMSKTLKQSIFIDELKRRHVAADHYINYLESTCKSREALELSRRMGF